MIDKLLGSLRRDVWLVLAAIAAFTGAAVVGNLTDGVESKLASLAWVGAIWLMLLTGLVLLVLVAYDGLMGKE